MWMATYGAIRPWVRSVARISATAARTGASIVLPPATSAIADPRTPTTLIPLTNISLARTDPLVQAPPR